MKVLITGASGFLGQYVLKILIKNDINIVAITRSSNNLFIHSSKLKIIEYDINKNINRENIFQKFGSPDILIHLAWGDLLDYNSSAHNKIHLTKHYNFLKNMIQGGLKSLIVSGTCFEYGNVSGELNESMNVIPCTNYGSAKNNLRKKIEHLKDENEFHFTWMRLFYLYGDGQHKNSIYTQLQSAIKQKKKYFKMSKGNQILDYIHVSKAALIVVKLAMAFKNIGIINVCNGSPLRLKDLVNYWIKQKKSSIIIESGFYPYRKDEPMEFWGNIEYLKKWI